MNRALCSALLKITKKPDKQEFQDLVKITGLGLLVIGLIAGCAGAPMGQPAFVALDRDSTLADVQSAQVFVDGRERGLTPGTLYVRRGFGEENVTLRRNGEVVRSFYVERVYTANSSDLSFSASQSGAGRVRHFDVYELNVTEAGSVIIPYLDGGPLEVTDRKYGLTLMVQE